MGYEQLKKLLERKPLLSADTVADEIRLLSDADGMKAVRRNASGVFPSAVLMDLSRALENFAKLVGKNERAFTVSEMAQIAGCPFGTVNDWVKAGVVWCSIDQSDDEGQAKERKSDWTDAFCAGVCGSLRRQGVPLSLLKKVRTTIANELPKRKGAANV